MNKTRNSPHSNDNREHTFLKGIARAKVIPLAFAMTMAAASPATATLLTVNTDSSWLATNSAPAPAWNSDASFDTTGWINATVNVPACQSGADCIWYDGQFSATQFAWLRKTFTISDPVSSAVLSGGVDDDADIYVNGSLVFSDHNGFAQNFGPIDVASFLVQGVNLIAVAAADNFPVFGQNHSFVARVQIETRNTVPEPASLLLLASGGVVLTLVRFRSRLR